MKIVVAYIIIVSLSGLYSCQRSEESTFKLDKAPEQFLLVLGIAQDAGYPQMGCTQKCCDDFRKGKESKKHVTSLALMDKRSMTFWLFEATPDITEQMNAVSEYSKKDEAFKLNGIFVSHAHIGHYAGLMQLGREATNTTAVPVYAMPRMDSFLRNNGPWSQLIKLENIRINNLSADSTVRLHPPFIVTPFKVPHRDEYSETVGFIIEGSHKKVLFIPDIDKWEKWERDIVDEIKKVDIALLDATFYQAGELPGRDMKEIPHPFVQESITKFAGLPLSEKNKIIFIHFNHTNPLVKQTSDEKKKVKSAGYKVAEEGMTIEL